MKASIHITYIFIIAVLLFFLFKGCGKNADLGVTSIATTTTIDTILGPERKVFVPVPYAVNVHDTLTDTIPGEPVVVKVDNPDLQSKIDELQKRLDYYDIPTTYYDNSYPLDSGSTIRIKDTARGLLLGRSISFSLLQKTQHIKESRTDQRFKIGIGAEYLYPSNYIGVAAILQFKTGVTLKIGYGAVENKGQYSAGIYKTIKLR